MQLKRQAARFALVSQALQAQPDTRPGLEVVPQGIQLCPWSLGWSVTLLLCIAHTQQMCFAKATLAGSLTAGHMPRFCFKVHVVPLHALLMHDTVQMRSPHQTLPGSLKALRR